MARQQQNTPVTKPAGFRLSTTAKQVGFAVVIWSALISAIALDLLHDKTVLLAAVVSLMLASLGGLIWFNGACRHSLAPLHDWLVEHGHAHGDNEANILDGVLQALQAREEDLMSQLDLIATEVDKLAHDVTNSIALTNQGVSHQKKETEKLTHAMSEMLTTAESVSSSAHDASQAANDAENSAREGQSILHTTTQAISELADQVEQSSTVIANLARDSDSIGAILDVIKGIAEQTNLLALNAAIEAARAGEQGRGFAVVADEVRSLASRTHQSTSEIESMIQRLQQAAQSATNTMSGGHEIAQSSVQQVSQAVAALDAITTAVERIKIMNTQIASAAEEQSAVTQEVKNNVETIDEVSELTIETLEGLNETGHNMEQLGSTIRHYAADRN